MATDEKLSILVFFAQARRTCMRRVPFERWRSIPTKIVDALNASGVLPYEVV